MQITILSQAAEFKEFRFKPAERPLFREINQSPLILYPIKEAVNQTRHKISLMIQAHLGCVQYPDSLEAAKVRRQLMVERKLVFERLNRLIRAVIDCKGYDRDSISTKSALELARALAAESWEGRATQLTQIPGIGPAGMRKLASKDIRTVVELADKGYDEIERLMSRQPPFGKNLQVHLERFPRLAMDVEMVGRKMQPRSQEPVMIDVKATLRYLNRKGLPNWLQRVPPLTFLAESDDGILVYFWRGSMKKLETQSSFELRFSVGLRKVSECIKCHFSCEDIVGTMVSQTLEPNLPPSAFPSLPVATVCEPGLHTRVRDRQYSDSDGIDDIDLLLAAERASAHSSMITAVKPIVRAEDDEYIPVENLLNVSGSEGMKTVHDGEHRFAAASHGDEGGIAGAQAGFGEPVQLPNGKWKCSHACSGGAPTRSGKPCSHRCCKEGIDKPRKRPSQRPKRKTEELAAESTVGGIGLGRVQAQNRQPTKLTNISATGSQVKRRRVQPLNSLTKLTNASHPNRLPNISEADWDRADFNTMDIEFIDLSFTDEEEDGFFKRSMNGRRDRSEPVRGATRKTTVENHTCQGKLNQDTLWDGATVQSAPTQGVCIVAEKERTAAPLSSRQDDYFDDNDLSFLDHEFSPPCLITPEPAVTPFKSGASDEVLYQGISNKFAEAGSAAVSDWGIDLGAKTMTNTGPVFPHPRSSVFVEETPKPMMVNQQPQSMNVTEPEASVAHVVADAAGEEPRRPKQDIEPDWVTEFDPEIVDMFRGYVTFV